MTATACTRVRLRFAKRGVLRLVSHHDLMRCLERALRRAEIPMAYSQGFNPRPKVVFPLALGLGIEARREILELETAEPIAPADLLARLAAVMPPGFDLLEAEPIAPGRPGRPVAALYELPIPEDRRAATAEAVARLLAAETLPYTRHRPDRDRSIPMDLRPFVLGAGLEPDGSLRFRLLITSGGSARPEEFAEALGLRDLLDGGAFLVRADVELADPPAPAGPTRPIEPTQHANMNANANANANITETSTATPD